MARIAVACPTCGHSGAVDEAALPAGPVRAKCPKCQGTFAFTKGIGVAPARSGGPPPPPGSGPGQAPPSGPSRVRAPSPPQGKPAPPARSRRKILAIVGTAACGVVVLTAVWMFVFQTAPIVKEKLWIAALYSRIPPVQQVAIKALRNYPTKHAAVSLVLFINLKNLQWVPDPKKPETPEEKARRLAVRKRDLKLAERATETLCLLTGQSFGTYFKLERYGYSWGSLSEDKWPAILRQVDAWALQTLGGIDLPILTLGVPAVVQQPTEPAAGEVAR